MSPCVGGERRCRKTSTAFSALRLNQLPVPSSAVLRFHPERPPIQRTRLFWWEVLHPLDVVVLGVRNASGLWLHGWFTRFDDAPEQLVRLPHGYAYEMWQLLNETPELKKSRLPNEFLEAYFASPRDDFLAVAQERFERKAFLVEHSRTAEAIYAERAPKRAAVALPRLEDCMQGGAHRGAVCAVCLEEEPERYEEPWLSRRCDTADSRRLVRPCCTTVCIGCHLKLHSLCPVCSRSKISGHSQCGACGESVPFSESGFRCASCPAQTLCRTCWIDHEECPRCDPLCTARCRPVFD